MPTSLADLLQDQSNRRKALQELERFIFEDQWASGEGWTGPKPVDLDEKAESSVLTLIERQFVSRNVLAEVITRHRDGVVGREPNWSLTTPTAGRKKVIAEAEEALTVWWDETGVHLALQEAVRTLLYARETSRRGEAPRAAYSPLRLFIRSQSIRDGVVPRRTSLAEALDDLRVHAAAPYAAGVLRNLDGDPIATRYAYRDDDGNVREEITGLARILREFDLEVPDGAADDDTVILVQDMSGTVLEVAAYQLGGRLLMHEMTREPLITPSSLALQKLINKTWTMMSHNLDLAGFTERTLLNAQMPGRWLDENGDPAARPEDGVRFQPDPVFVGAGATNWFSGIPQYDSDGSVRYTSPQVVYRDPVPPDAFTETLEAARTAIYEESKQLHVLISGDATASGVSRTQATNDFVASLQMTGAQVAHATRWLLSTALSLASVLMGQAGRYEDLRPTVTPRITAVQPTPEDVRMEIEKRDAGLQSTQTARSRVGIEDVDAEAALIAAEASAPPPRPGSAAASGVGASAGGDA